MMFQGNKVKGMSQKSEYDMRILDKLDKVDSLSGFNEQNSKVCFQKPYIKNMQNGYLYFCCTLISNAHRNATS
jgi:hypothetical protein